MYCRFCALCEWERKDKACIVHRQSGPKASVHGGKRGFSSDNREPAIVLACNYSWGRGRRAHEGKRLQGKVAMFNLWKCLVGFFDYHFFLKNESTLIFISWMIPWWANTSSCKSGREWCVIELGKIVFILPSWFFLVFFFVLTLC